MKQNLLYLEIVNKIRIMITSSQYAYRLPSERQLAQHLSVSRVTVRQALQLLVDQDLIEKKRGSATFIKNQHILRPLLKAKSFKEEMLALGKEYSVQILVFRTENSSLATAYHLHIKEKELVYYFERIFIANGIPLLFEKSYMPVDLFPDLTLDHLKVKFDYIEQVKHFTILDSSERIYSVLSDNTISEVLKISPCSILSVILHLRLTNRRYADYSCQYYHPNYSFTLIRQRDLD